VRAHIVASLGFSLAALLTAAPAAVPARADSPSATSLLTLATAYATMRGSVHITLHGQVVGGSESAIITGFEDQSQRYGLLRDVQIDSGDVQEHGEWTKGSVRTSVEGVGGSGAMKVNKSDWLCGSLDNSDYSIVPALPSARLSSPVLVPGHSVPVWKIVANASEGLNMERETFYVTGMGRLVRTIFIAVHSGSAQGGPRQQIYLIKDYSHWGESVRVSLPAACRPPMPTGTPTP